jgi:hypothetical protein
MPRARNIKKMKLPIAELRAMDPKHRSALLLLGLFLNEANWLRKLLVKAVLGISGEPEGQANFALTTLIATTLAGKIYEAWDRITEGHLSETLNALGPPQSIEDLKQKLAETLAGKTFVRIRNNIAFHYPERPLDFQTLEQHLGDSDSIIYMAPEGYGGDVLSHLSTLAGIEPLLAINRDSDYLTALRTVWEEVTEATGLYCVLVSELIAMIVQKFIPGLSFEDVIIPDAPETEEGLLRFFAHPPEDLEELRASLATSDPTIGSSKKLSS